MNLQTWLQTHLPGVSLKSADSVLNLTAEGATIPFIARYRKDKTGALDEVQIQQIQEEAKFQQEFADRKSFIEKTISEQGKMTGFLQGKINEATTLNELEDIYLPYKPEQVHDRELMFEIAEELQELMQEALADELRKR